MKICLTGDTFLGGDLKDSKMDNIILFREFHHADYRIINLEQAISDSSLIISKGTLYTDSKAIHQLKRLNVNAVNLANNHIQDKGVTGISDTIHYLNHSNIGVFGAGEDILHAKKYHRINDSVVIFGYCDFDKYYLNQIEVAESKKAGINPLRYNNILNDLNSLKDDTKAILYFHWGKEHVFLPRYSDIELARKLLLDHRVLFIVGMHPHRPQGILKFNNKKAYMSLGNFLFPNFHISPPAQLYYPHENEKIMYQTKRYHRVFENTYKKWKWINRISIVIEYDVTKNITKEILVKQNANTSQVRRLQGLEKLYVQLIICIVSKFLLLPRWIYSLLENIHTRYNSIKWLGHIYLFKIHQLGFKKSLNIFLKRHTI